MAGFIDAMPREDVNAPRKQRQTIDRICQRLAAEHASYSTVGDHLRNRRPQSAAGAMEGRRHLGRTVPQGKRSGEDAEVDYRDVWVDLAGQRRRCEWDKSLTGPRPCAAIGDRITFKGTLIRTGTGSYRPKVTENGYRSTGRS
ncbi:hypothetical protein ACWGCW_00035 [Streptomyces sp. NPDC054933]